MATSLPAHFALYTVPKLPCPISSAEVNVSSSRLICGTTSFATGLRLFFCIVAASFWQYISIICTFFVSDAELFFFLALVKRFEKVPITLASETSARSRQLTTTWYAPGEVTGKQHWLFPPFMISPSLYHKYFEHVSTWELVTTQIMTFPSSYPHISDGWWIIRLAAGTGTSQA